MNEQAIASGTDSNNEIHDLKCEIDKLKFELRKKEKKLQQKDEELQNHLYTVSHELKTPVVSIQGFISLILAFHKDSINDEISDYFERINRNLIQMEELINDLLEFSGIEIAEDKFESVSFNVIIDNALSELQYQIDKAPIRIEIIDNLPSVYCQTSQIVRVFTNLISNAIKYSCKDKTPEIKIGYSADEIFHKFYVKDNGVGIPSGQRNKLFRMFSRLGNKKGVGGTGLGLAIAKRVIEAHGGEIWVESRRNKGATFFFTLPKLTGKKE